MANPPWVLRMRLVPRCPLIRPRAGRRAAAALRGALRFFTCFTRGFANFAPAEVLRCQGSLWGGFLAVDAAMGRNAHSAPTLLEDQGGHTIDLVQRNGSGLDSWEWLGRVRAVDLLAPIHGVCRHFALDRR